VKVCIGKTDDHETWD